MAEAIVDYKVDGRRPLNAATTRGAEMIEFGPLPSLAGIVPDRVAAGLRFWAHAPIRVIAHENIFRLACQCCPRRTAAEASTPRRRCGGRSYAASPPRSSGWTEQAPS
jgi:hypothetical protein